MLIACNNDKLCYRQLIHILNNGFCTLIYIHFTVIIKTYASCWIRQRVKRKRIADFQAVSSYFYTKIEPRSKHFWIQTYARNREMSNATTSQKLPSANALIVFIVFKSLSLIVGIFGNTCVIIYNVCLKHSKTPTTYFVVNLAINDFFACCLIYPIWMTTFTRSALQITRDTTRNTFNLNSLCYNCG